MTVEEAIRHRRSIYRFLPDAVSTRDIRDMLALAQMTPNIGNRQPWRFIVVTDEHLRRMLGRLVERKLEQMATWPEFAAESLRLRAWKTSSMHFADAPALIFFVSTGYRTPLDVMLVEHGSKHWQVADLFGHPDVQSISSLMAYLTLIAEERGYGTCWSTDLLIAHDDLHAALTLSPHERLTGVISIGKPDEYPPPKSRKAIDDLIDWR